MRLRREKNARGRLTGVTKAEPCCRVRDSTQRLIRCRNPASTRLTAPQPLPGSRGKCGLTRQLLMMSEDSPSSAPHSTMICRDSEMSYFNYVIRGHYRKCAFGAKRRLKTTPHWRQQSWLHSTRTSHSSAHDLVWKSCWAATHGSAGSSRVPGQALVHSSTSPGE